MKTHPTLGRATVLMAAAMVAAGSAAAGPLSYISDSEAITAIAARTFNDYERTKTADGSFTRETFVFGNGGEVPDGAPGNNVTGALYGMGGRGSHGSFSGAGYAVRDPSIDDLSFPSIARMVEGPLAQQNYRPSTDPSQTKLLIMVFWGRAEGAGDVVDGPAHDALIAYNGQLMGFDQEGWLRAHNDWSTMFWGRNFHMEIVDSVHGWNLSALEADRYYVVLRAFDFQSAWKDKKLKLLWETRFSLSERGHGFNEELPVMAQAASHYFGQVTGGLVRTPLKQTEVEIGALKNLTDDTADGPK